MSDTAQATAAKKNVEKEAEHRPYDRPKDAAKLIPVECTGSVPKVLVGRGHDKVVNTPGALMFLF